MTNFFLVRLPNINYYLFNVNEKKDTKDEAVELYENLTEQETKVIEYLKQYNSIRRVVVEDILDIKNTKAKEVINSLIAKGLVKADGTGPATKYILIR